MYVSSFCYTPTLIRNPHVSPAITSNLEFVFATSVMSFNVLIQYLGRWITMIWPVLTELGTFFYLAQKLNMIYFVSLYVPKKMLSHNTIEVSVSSLTPSTSPIYYMWRWITIWHILSTVILLWPALTELWSFWLVTYIQYWLLCIDQTTTMALW